MTRERPIAFSAPMVRALLAGRKTQTRRVAKLNASGRVARAGRNWHCDDPEARLACPYGQPGERLWVRERHALHNRYRNVWCRYAADDVFCVVPAPTFVDVARPGWRPSIHMPRWASRITLEIVDVRVERLQDISEAGAIAEGASFHDGHGVGHSGWRHDYGAVHCDARSSFARLWNEISGAGAWEANPWVWVIEFRPIRPNAEPVDVERREPAEATS